MHSEVSYQDISSKLVLLTLHFPNVSKIDSMPHATIVY